MGWHRLLTSTLEVEFSLLDLGSDALSAFTLLPDLPLELRTKLWQSTLPIRLVEIYFLHIPYYLRTPKLPIPLLHVSHESQKVALKRYKPLYRPASALLLIYIDPLVDILFVNEYIHEMDEVLSELNVDVLLSLRHIAFAAVVIFVIPNFEGRLLACLLRLSSLNIITARMLLTDSEHENGYAVFFELFKIPMVKWPKSVNLNDEHVFTRKALEHKDEVIILDAQWIRNGFNKIEQAVEEQFCTCPGRIPQVDLQGVWHR